MRRRPATERATRLRATRRQDDPGNHRERRVRRIGRVRPGRTFAGERARVLVAGFQARRLRRISIVVVACHGTQVARHDADSLRDRSHGARFALRVPVRPGRLQCAGIDDTRCKCKHPRQQHHRSGAAPASWGRQLAHEDQSSTVFARHRSACARCRGSRCRAILDAAHSRRISASRLTACGQAPSPSRARIDRTCLQSLPGSRRQARQPRAIRSGHRRSPTRPARHGCRTPAR